ncbi:MAG: class I SAM-dependent methyltransferase [Candidatus Levybacteria bacterium]|nr:class I SAM-dependent methyltransferase [Candidatus Levybacteria bacterium]
MSSTKIINNSKKNTRKLYEDFHKISLVQKKIIKKNNFTYRNLIEILEKYIKNYQIKSALDIGCGVGTVSLYLGNKGIETFGIDISKKAILAASESAKLLELNNVSFKVMNFPDEVPSQNFDLIICSEVLEHLENDNLAFKRFYSNLKNGGLVIISTPSKNAPLYRLGMAKKFDLEVGHLRRYSLEELIVKCRRNKFIVIETFKKEGILRNFLFLNPLAGKLIRFIKFFASDIITFFDEILAKVFGESNLFLVMEKKS